MSTSFSGITTTLDQQGVLASWCFQSQLVKREDLTSCFEDTNSGTLSESESTHCQLGDIQESEIINMQNEQRLLEKRQVLVFKQKMEAMAAFFHY